MMDTTQNPNRPKAALCVGHPGHELRVYGWMREFRPVVDVFTDGSGPNRPPRIESSLRVVERTDCRVGGVFGRYPDRQFYEMMQAGDPGPFIALAEELAGAWEADGVEVVAGDMIEGFNTTHDVCRMVINAAVDHLQERRGRVVMNYEFPLEAILPLPAPEGSLVIEVDDDVFSEKRATAFEMYPEMADEVERAVAKYGLAPFKNEILLEARPDAGLEWSGDKQPFYERYGAKQVESGHYASLITYAGHIQPIARALRKWSAG